MFIFLVRKSNDFFGGKTWVFVQVKKKSSRVETFQDSEWVECYISRNRELLKQSFGALREFCKEKDWNVIFKQPEAGMFVVLDLRKYLKENSWEGEMQLFRLIFEESKVCINPGRYFGFTEPGFFRLCYGRRTSDVVKIAMQKLYELFEQQIRYWEYFLQSDLL